MTDFEWGRISTKIYLKNKTKPNVSLYGFMNLKLKTSSQLATKVTSFEIKKDNIRVFISQISTQVNILFTLQTYIPK